MQRQILCIKCESELKKNLTPDYVYPYDRASFIYGDLKVKCKCDVCGKSLNIFDKAYAISMWSIKGNIKHFDWEWDYIKTIKEDEWMA